MALGQEGEFKKEHKPVARGTPTILSCRAQDICSAIWTFWLL